MKGSEFRTEYANRAYIVANLFNTKFQHFDFHKGVKRIVMVMPSEEQSTAGGKLARTVIALKPLAGSSAMPVNAGWFDVGRSEAELLTFQALKDAHEQRHGKKGFKLDPDEYEPFLDAAKAFLEGEGFNVNVKGGHTIRRKGSPLPIVLAVSLLVVGAAGAVVYFLGGDPTAGSPQTKPAEASQATPTAEGDPAESPTDPAEKAAEDSLAMALRDCPSKDISPKLSRRLRKTFDGYLKAGGTPRNATTKVFHVAERLDDKEGGTKLDIAVATACVEQAGDDTTKTCRLVKLDLVRKRPRGKRWSAWKVSSIIENQRLLCEKLK